jgi:hypothetical protein
MWYFERNTPIEEYKNLHLLSDTCKNALMVEFFDGVGLFIHTKSKFGQRRQKQIFWYSIGTINQPTITYEDRQDCLNNAIIHANNIYNKKK